MTVSDLIDGLSTATAGGQTLDTASRFDVVNPATGEVFAQAPAVTSDQLDLIFGAAHEAQRSWRTDEAARRRVMLSAAEVIEQRSDELAPILTAEQGKPIPQAKNEFLGAAAWLPYFATLDVPREILRDDAERYEEILRRLLGVVAAITPWNFPIALAMWKIAPALRTGNTIVVKPSPYTPLATLALGSVLRDVLPPGVLSVVSGTEPLGADMVSHPLVSKVSFTGSTAVGRHVAVGAAHGLKRVTLELGGNDPAVVLADADVPTVAQKIFDMAFANSGQVCVAVKRVYAHERVHAQLVEALAEIARSVKVDEGTVDGAALGPLNNLPQYDRVRTLVTDALEHGARPAAGGAPIERPGYFFSPTILDNVGDGIRVVDEEQFGPVLPVIPFRDEADAIARANRSEYGLTASMWSSDLQHAAEVAADIDAGQVSLNEHGSGVAPHLPFGGHKSSGIGVENGIWGLHSFTDMQLIIGPARR